MLSLSLKNYDITIEVAFIYGTGLGQKLQKLLNLISNSFLPERLFQKTKTTFFFYKHNVY